MLDSRITFSSTYRQQEVHEAAEGQEEEIQFHNEFPLRVHSGLSPVTMDEILDTDATRRGQIVSLYCRTECVHTRKYDAHL